MCRLLGVDAQNELLGWEPMAVRLGITDPDASLPSAKPEHFRLHAATHRLIEDIRIVLRTVARTP